MADSLDDEALLHKLVQRVGGRVADLGRVALGEPLGAPPYEPSPVCATRPGFKNRIDVWRSRYRSPLNPGSSE